MPAYTVPGKFSAHKKDLPEPNVDSGGLLVLAPRPTRPPPCGRWRNGRRIRPHLFAELQVDRRRLPLTRLRDDINRPAGQRRATRWGARHWRSIAIIVVRSFRLLIPIVRREPVGVSFPRGKPPVKLRHPFPILLLPAVILGRGRHIQQAGQPPLVRSRPRSIGLGRRVQQGF